MTPHIHMLMTYVSLIIMYTFSTDRYIFVLTLNHLTLSIYFGLVNIMRCVSGSATRFDVSYIYTS